MVNDINDKMLPVYKIVLMEFMAMYKIYFITSCRCHTVRPHCFIRKLQSSTIRIELLTLESDCCRVHPCSVVKNKNIVFMHENSFYFHGNYIWENRPGSCTKIENFDLVTAKSTYVYFSIEKSAGGVFLSIDHTWQWAPATTGVH